MKIKRVSLILVFILISNLIYSQVTNLSETITSIAEELEEENGDLATTELYIEKLQELSDNPVSLNSAGEQELSRLFFLTDFQIKALADYIHSSGKILSIYEIASIPGFDGETASMLVPFIKLNTDLKNSSDTLNLKNSLISNFSVKSGTSDNTNSGSNLRVLAKYKFISGPVTAGLTVEKDPGEKFLSGNPKQPDFMSGYIIYNGSGILKKLIAGDFSARFGMGTNINTGIRTGLSVTSTGYMSANDEIKAYTSTDENNFFRGIALALGLRKFDLITFYSENRIDATLNSLSGTSNDYIESFYRSGIHNTNSTLLKKDAARDVIAGLNFSINSGSLRIGTTLSIEKFSLPVIPESDGPGEIYNFRGDENTVASIYYKSLINRILLYGEISMSENRKTAVIQGFSLRPNDRVTLNITGRKCTTGYISFHGNGPGNNQQTGNEEGLLGNFNFEAAKHLFISGGADFRIYTWIRYRCSSPSSGMKREIRLKYLPSEKFTIDLIYNSSLSVSDNQDSLGIPKQNEVITKSIRGSVRYNFNENLVFTTRIDFKNVACSNSSGVMLLQDINYRFKNIPLTIWFRYSIFNTDSWDSRIYAYENDILYSYSIPACSGAGSRSYLMLKWDIKNIADVRIKYGITTVSGDTYNIKNSQELKLQVKFSF
jgi:hypothetical protein